MQSSGHHGDRGTGGNPVAGCPGDRRRARAIVIRLAPGQEVGGHQVRERAWLTVVEGAARIEAGGDVVEAGPATLLTFEPGERHSVASQGGARILLILSPWPGEGHYPET